MADLARKQQQTANEAWIVVLVVQVFLGFQLRAPFESGFDQLPPGSHLLIVIAAVLFVASFLILVAPAPFHRIARSHEVTADLQSYSSTMLGLGLMPFIAALALNIFVMLRSVVPPIGGWLAIAFAAVMSWLWYGFPLLRRSLPAPRTTSMQQAPLEQRIQHVLTEVRVILPGAQALLGFQFVTFLMAPFQSLPAPLKRLHAVALLLVALATVLLMAPAAFHRIAEHGEESERVPRFSSWMILGALPLLVAGIALDAHVVVTKALGDGVMAFAVPVGTLVVAAILWAIYPLMRRRRSSV